MTSPQSPRLPAHEQWEQLAVGHALDALEPDDDDTFASHLPTCESCRRLVAEMRDVAAGLAYAADPVEAPPALWQSIAAAVASSDRPPLRPGTAAPASDSTDAASIGSTPTRRAEDLRPPRTPDPGAPRPRPVWLRSMAMAFAAALIGIIALGGVVLVGRYLQVRSDKVAAESQLSAVLSCAGRPDCAVVQLKAQGKSSASAVALVQAGTVQLVVNGLPPTGRDSSYVLWAGLPGGGVTGVGRFVISGGGRHIISPDLKSAVVVSRGRLLAVTKEPGRQIPAAPSTKPILAGTAA